MPAHKKLTIDNSTMQALYDSGKTIAEIALSLGVSTTCIQRRLNKTRSMSEIQKLRYANCSGYWLNKKFSSKHRKNISRSLTTSFMTAEGAARRVDYSRKKRIYTLDEHYFSSIDSQEKAYFLGFLYADGNLSRAGNALSVELQERDMATLEWMKEQLRSDKPLIYRSSNNSNQQNTYVLKVHSLAMKNDLCKLGMVPCKSRLLFSIPEIKRELQLHFIRGYFDGDGSIYKYGKRRYLAVKIVSNQRFIEQLANVLHQHNISANIRLIKGLLWELTIYKQADVVTFGDLIYNGATVFLTRKHEKFNNSATFED